MAASYQNTYTMNADMEVICRVIKSPAFASTLNVVFKSENPSTAGVWFRFHHGATFTSWGEKITITLSRMNEGLTRVEIHSECGMPTQVVDWGKNKQVVCNVYEYIEKHLEAAKAAPAPQPPMNHPPATDGPRFCSSCGKAIPPNGAFCPFCGKKICR